jgi:L-fuconolactonase
MIIDAHAHLWTLSRGDYGWLTPSLGSVYRDFGPDDLKARLDAHAVDRAILVQAAPTVDETQFLLSISRQNSFVAGVVGWADFDAKDAPVAIELASKDPPLLGLRPMVQDMADESWLSKPHLSPALEAMSALGLVFDALVLPRHLSHLAKVARHHPNLSIVIDHLAKPEVKAGRIEPWAGDMAVLAALPNVTCKLSGLITEAGMDWRAADLAPYFRTVLELFGPDRLIWGSDWPVANLAGGYDAWVAASDELLARLTARERAKIRGGNAARIYLSKGRGS